MAYFRCGGGGIPASLKSGMNDVLNKKFGTSTTYPPTGWPDNVNLLGPLPIKTASGAIASFSDGADDVPIAEGVFSISAQGGGGSPSQPIPIVGFTGMTVNQTGKNLLNPTLYDGGAYNPTVDSQRTFTESATQFTHVGNTYSVSFTESWKTYTMLMPVKYVQAYYCNFTLSGTGTNLGTSVYFVDADGKVLASASNNTSNPQTRTFAVNVPSGAKYFCITFTNRGTSETTLTFTEPQIEVGSTATTYEAYKSKTPIQVSWQSEAGTIYGGELYDDGALHVTHNTVDLGTLEWTYHPATSSYEAFFDSYLPSDSITGDSAVAFDGYCEIYKAIKSSVIALPNQPLYDNNVMALANNSRRIIICDTRYSSASDFKTAMDGVILVYPLATPIILAIDPIDISTYYGSNNIWCDTGESAIQYRADIDLALNS